MFPATLMLAKSVCPEAGVDVSRQFWEFSYRMFLLYDASLASLDF